MNDTRKQPAAREESEGADVRMRFTSVVWRLTSANALITVLALVTSPILARTLGPDGRGELAAIFTVLTLAPWISDLGLSAYLARERARSEPRGLLLGSVMPVAIAASLVGVAIAVPVAHLLGQGREDVTLFVEIGLFMLPLTVFTQTLYGLILGEQRWRLIVLTRVLAAGLPAIAIVVLALTDSLTVETVSISYLVASVVGNAPLLIGLRGSIPWRFRWSVSRDSISFGLKSWVSTVALTTNARLDQLLMAGLVSSRQLGLYALAVTLSTVTGSLMAAVANALFPRVAEGEASLAAQATRVTTAMVLVLNIAIGAASPLFVPLVFGDAFSESVPMLAILLAASVIGVASHVLASCLTAGGDPASAARSQIVGLVITIPALLVLLSSFGGIAAAWISLASYSVSLVIALRASVRLFGLPVRKFLLPEAADVAWLRARLLGGARTG